MWGSRDRTRLGRGERGRWIALGILVAWVGMSRLEGGAAAPETGQAPGLVAEFWDAADKERVLDVDVFTQLALFVPAGDPVSSFLESDSFEVEWSGALSVPLRDDFRFRVWVSGQVELMLNGESVLTQKGQGGWGKPTEELRLKKGANPIRVRYRNRPNEDSVLRVEWSSPDFLFEPIKASHWSHTPTPGLRRFEDLRDGLALFDRYRCEACHLNAGGNDRAGLTGLGVNLSGIGSRRGQSWMADWILHPKNLREQATMPRVFTGATAVADAQAAAHFLANQRAVPASESVDRLRGGIRAGQQLFEDLNCAGCHRLDGEPRAGLDGIGLDHVLRKFGEDALIDFLSYPERHYQLIRMPNFGLSRREASDLAAYLVSKCESDEPVGGGGQGNEALIERGRKLVGARGCLHCHEGLEENFEEHEMANRHPIERFDRGCLSPGLGSLESPRFEFTAEEVRLLRMVLEEGQGDRYRPTPRESFVELREALRCDRCHGEIQGVPGMGAMGAKLKPAWMRDLISGHVSDKPRPWLGARMPAFPGYADELAAGMSHRHGYSHLPDPPESVDKALAEVGRQLVSPFNGFSCVSCHGVGDLKPTQVFESEGINLVYSAERLQPEFYRRWLLNPIRIDSATKMPVYFDEEGNSPLYDVLEGDSGRQLDAIWQYLLLGSQMIPPPVE